MSQISSSETDITNRPLPVRYIDVTSSGNWASDFPNLRPIMPASEVTLLIEQAWELTASVENAGVASEARKLLTELLNVISHFQNSFDMTYLPKLAGREMEDGSLLFEWIFNNYRVGFSIEINKQESGWYLATNRNLGTIIAEGDFEGVDLFSLTTWLMVFIVFNSSLQYELS